MLVLRGMGAVDLVVCSHDGCWRRLRQRDLKGQKVDLSQCTLAHDTVYRPPLVLLVIGYEMFHRRADPHRVHTAHVRSSQLAGDIGIFGKRLKATTTKRRPLDVGRRTKPTVH